MQSLKILAFLVFCSFLIALAPPVAAQAEQVRTSTTYEIDWYLTPAEYPCLAETIHLTGTIDYKLHIIINPSGGYSYQYKETGAYKGLAAVGLISGAEYKFRGPLTWMENGWTDEPWVTWYPLEFTFHVLNFFIGPQNFTLSTVRHVTFDRETGELKVEILKEKVYCK